MGPMNPMDPKAWDPRQQPAVQTGPEPDHLSLGSELSTPSHESYQSHLAFIPVEFSPPECCPFNSPFTPASQPWSLPSGTSPHYWPTAALPPGPQDFTAHAMASSGYTTHLSQFNFIPGTPNPFPNTAHTGECDNLTMAISHLEILAGSHSHKTQTAKAPEPVDMSPEPTTPSNRIQCELCGERFANQKNLERHYLAERHNADAPKFKCACGYKQARKDNYRRHLTTCTFPLDLAWTYCCNCGHQSGDREHHVNHVEYCGRKRRRREKKQ